MLRQNNRSCPLGRLAYTCIGYPFSTLKDSRRGPALPQASGVEVRGYEEALEAVRALASEGKRVWLDPDRVNYAFANVVAKEK